MLYTFKCKASADLLMLENSAKQILNIIGKEATTKGIIEVKALPSAIEALEKAVADEKAFSKQSPQMSENNSENKTAHKEPVISLAQRAWPFIEMLKEANSAQEPIVWGV